MTALLPNIQWVCETTYLFYICIFIYLYLYMYTYIYIVKSFSWNSCACYGWWLHNKPPFCQLNPPDFVQAPSRFTMFRWGPRCVIIFSSDMSACFSLDLAVAVEKTHQLLSESNHLLQNNKQFFLACLIRALLPWFLEEDCVLYLIRSFLKICREVMNQ